jgi:hypothetical protein
LKNSNIKHIFTSRFYKCMFLIKIIFSSIMMLQRKRKSDRSLFNYFSICSSWWRYESFIFLCIWTILFDVTLQNNKEIWSATLHLFCKKRSMSPSSNTCRERKHLITWSLYLIVFHFSRRLRNTSCTCLSNSTFFNRQYSYLFSHLILYVLLFS